MAFNRVNAKNGSAPEIIRYRSDEDDHRSRDAAWRRSYSAANVALDQTLKIAQLLLDESQTMLAVHRYFQNRTAQDPIDAFWPAAYARMVQAYEPENVEMVREQLRNARACPKNRILGITEYEAFELKTTGGDGEVDAYYRYVFSQTPDSARVFKSRIALEWARFAANSYRESIKADELFELASKINPDDVLPLLELAERYIFDIPDLNRALAVLNRARSLDPDHPNLLGTIASLHLRLNASVAVALDLFERALASGMNESHLLARFIDLLTHEVPDLEKAVAIAENAIRLYPHEPKLLISMASAYEARDDMDPRIGQLLTQAIDLEPGNAKALCRLAEFMGRSHGSTDEAVKLFELSIVANPELASTYGTYAAYARTILKNPDLARELYSTALDLEPDRAPTLHNLAILYWYEFGEPDVARSLLERALLANPRHGPSHATYARLLHYLGQSPLLQKQHLQFALQFGSRNPADFADLAAHYLADGDHEAAKENLYRALELDPDNYLVLNRCGLFHLYDPRSMALAESYFRRAIEVNPAGFEAVNNLALIVQGSEGGTSEAANLLADAIRLNPDHMATYFNLACIRLAKGEAEEADRIILTGVRADRPLDLYLAGTYFAFYRGNLLEAQTYFDSLPGRCSLGSKAEITIATFQIANGHGYEGLKRFVRYFPRLSAEDLEQSTLFQSYVCYLFEQRGRRSWLKDVRRHSSTGMRLRTIWPNNTNIVALAEKSGHPDAEWLGVLNSFLFDETDETELADWNAWEDARPRSWFGRTAKVRL